MVLHGKNVSISFQKKVNTQKKNCFANKIWKGISVLASSLSFLCSMSVHLCAVLSLWLPPNAIHLHLIRRNNKYCSTCYISLVDTKLNYKQHFVWSMGELEKKKPSTLVLAQNGHWRIVAAKMLQNTLWRAILHSLGASSAPDLQLWQLCKLCRKPFHLYQPKIQLTVKHISKNFLVNTCLKLVSSSYQKSSFVMMAKIKHSSEEKENPQLSNYRLQQYFLREKVKRTTSQEILRISRDLMGNALQTASFVSNFEDLVGLIQQDGKVQDLTLKKVYQQQNKVTLQNKKPKLFS